MRRATPADEEWDAGAGRGDIEEIGQEVQMTNKTTARLANNRNS